MRFIIAMKGLDLPSVLTLHSWRASTVLSKNVETRESRCCTSPGLAPFAKKRCSLTNAVLCVSKNNARYVICPAVNAWATLLHIEHSCPSHVHEALEKLNTYSLFDS